MRRHVRTESELLKRARARLRADAVVIAAVAGNADCTYDLTVYDERNAAFDWYRSRQTKNAQSGAAACHQILKRFAGALEAHCGASLFNRNIGAANLRVIHF